MADFADVDTARRITKQLYPEALDIKFVEYGYDNLVALVDKKYAIRFPRYDWAYLRDKYEKLVLQDLGSLENISIPKILGEGNDPPYIVTSFVCGEHVSSDEVNRWTKIQQKKFGEQVAQFAFKMHSLLSTEKALEDQKQVGLNNFSFIEYALSKYNFSKSEQDKIAKDYYSRWKSLQNPKVTVVIHNDLQVMNLLFENRELAGVIDFGDATIGTPEQELRQMYRINELVLDSAVDTYEKLSGYKLDNEAIKIWAIVQELAAYADKLAANKTDHPGFLSAATYLQKWLPEGNWDYILKDIDLETSSEQ